MFSQVANFINLYWIQILLTIFIGYLLGSLNTPILLTKKLKNGTDIRTMGSGNAGLTNVLRCNGKIPALLIILVDVSKVMLAVTISGIAFSYLKIPGVSEFYIISIGKYLMGISCFIGHLYPCFFGFKGGKGVLFVIAMIFAVDFRLGILLLFVFALVVLIFKIVSLGSIIAAAFYPVFTFLITFFCDYRMHKASIHYVIFSTAISLIIGLVIILKHKQNIIRLLNKTEKKILINKN